MCAFLSTETYYLSNTYYSFTHRGCIVDLLLLTHSGPMPYRGSPGRQHARQAVLVLVEVLLVQHGAQLVL